MKFSLQTRFRGMEPSDFISNDVWDHAQKLDAFDAVRRQLEDFVRRQRGVEKERHVPSHGRVVRIFPPIRSLKIGDEVRFSEEAGEKGPQVTSMKRVGHGGHLNAPI